MLAHRPDRPDHPKRNRGAYLALRFAPLSTIRLRTLRAAAYLSQLVFLLLLLLVLSSSLKRVGKVVAVPGAEIRYFLLALVFYAVSVCRTKTKVALLLALSGYAKRMHLTRVGAFCVYWILGGSLLLFVLALFFGALLVAVVCLGRAIRLCNGKGVGRRRDATIRRERRECKGRAARGCASTADVK